MSGTEHYDFDGHIDELEESEATDAEQEAARLRRKVLNSETFRFDARDQAGKNPPKGGKQPKV